MRTSVEIGDAILRRARALSARRGTTLRALIEEGLSRVLNEARSEEPFTLADHRFKGQAGFAPGMTEADVIKSLRDDYEARADAIARNTSR